MKLGTKIAIVGLVLIGVGLLMSAGTTSTEMDCNFAGGTCQESTSFEPNPWKPFFTNVGGFLFTVGLGAFVGTYDAEQRMVHE
jgi:hypothetical protein